MPVRNAGFEKVLAEYPEDQVRKLMEYHVKNGGLSRYVKFRYFFEEIRNEEISDLEVNSWANKFSSIMLQHLINPNLLIEETINYIQNHFQTYDMYIVSGSDEKELQTICKELELDKFFKSIHGSPTPKVELIKRLIVHNQLDSDRCALVGDSINDFDAADKNGIKFYGYNNDTLVPLGNYINSFSNFKMKY